MNVSKRILVSLCLFLGLRQNYLYGQEKSKVQYGKVAPSDFTLPASSVIDSNAKAVVIADIGETHFVGNSKGWFSYVFRKHTRIKILNKEAFDLATVKIHLYSQDDYEEKVDKLEAATYNLEDGKVLETRLDKKEIFDDKLDKNRVEKKFTMPAVKEGSIIEYTYTITSPYYSHIPSWEFQSQEHPVLWSEYSVAIPQTLSYAQIRHGIHGYYIDKAEMGQGSYRVTEKIEAGIGSGPERDLTVSATIFKHRWVIKDLPAFHVENYISSPYNYIDRLEFQLAQTNNGEDTEDHMNNWKNANADLLKKDYFGGALQQDNSWLNSLAAEAMGNVVEPLEQARAIYYYVSSHFTCTDHHDWRITTTLQDVCRKHNGSAGDINLLMIAMLRKKNIMADPVLLSSRAHGFVLRNYPVMERYDYAIARVKIEDKVYYLDAGRPQLGFGQLSPDCYNGNARIISEKDSGSVDFYADSLREKKTTMVVLTIDDKGGMEGSYQSLNDFPGSYTVREKIRSIGEKEYFKNIQTSYGEDLEINNTGIDSLDKPEMPVKVYYNFKVRQNADASSIIYLNPLFADPLRTNPFKALERKYPVEMPFVMDNSYIFNLDIPEGYKVEELPKSARVALNDKEGMYEYLIASDGASIQLRARVRLAKATFSAEDYQTLRDFFAFIVKKGNEQIVLKKK